MSRIAKNPIAAIAGVDVKITGQQVDIKGPKGSLQLIIHEDVNVMQDESSLRVAAKNGGKAANAMAGTMRSLLNNMVMGVSTGFEKKLKLVGVGYRAQMKGSDLSLTLGFSHPVEYSVPEGVKIETPSQTDIIISGIDKQQVGQTAAEIRDYRKPEPYKGKGVRYADETIVLKEAKKK